MYNSKQKEKFLEDFTEVQMTKDRLIRIFNSIEMFEKNSGKDFSQFTREKAVSVIAQCGGKTTNSVNSMIILLRKYLDWCILNQLVDRNISNFLEDVDSTKIKFMETHKNELISSPEHFQEHLDKYGYNPNVDTIDIMACTALWLAFSGIQDVVNVKKDDIDLIHGVVNFDFKTYKIYPQSVHTFKKALQMKTIEIESDIRSSYTKDLENTPYLIRMTVSTNFRKVSRMIYLTDWAKELTITSVYRSGMYYRIYEKERRADRIEYKDILIEEGFHDSEPNASQVKAFMNDYQQWKKTFKL
jgi:hypothetical protein